MSVPLPPLMASVKVQLPTASGLNSNVSPACMTPLSNGVPPAGTLVDLKRAAHAYDR